MPQNERLRELFAQRALAFGDFTLASGAKSSYYVNSKRVLFHAEAISLLGNALHELCQDLTIDAVGGLEVGAIPMTAAMLMAYHQAGKSLEGFFVRKKPKTHGSQDLVEGQVASGHSGGDPRRRSDHGRQCLTSSAGRRSVGCEGVAGCLHLRSTARSCGNISRV